VGIVFDCTGYINKKKSDGLIVPSWVIHPIANLFSGICTAFSIIWYISNFKFI